ncbi:hypothetical protein [Cohnella boryungensis]|uniref:Uncharacterized protein n=1 Tax=Cohnella boryungensis TaxID=768479 RepID=A0ABV8SIR5_9BACL
MNIVSRFHVLHGGKGTHAKIVAESEFAYYVLLYKAALPSNAGKELRLLMERDNPCQLKYAFAPRSPIELMDKAKQM